MIRYPKRIGKMIFKRDNLKRFSQWNSLKKKSQLPYTSCQFSFSITEPNLIAKIKVIKLSHVLVNMLPKRALARFTRKINAKNKAAKGPVPGRIPENTPNPNPKAIFWGESFILTSFI